MSGQNRHDVLRKAAHRGAAGAAATNRSGPLRRVVSETSAPIQGHPDIVVPRLELECGHLVRYPKGPFGVLDYIAGTRRRCDQCGRQP